MARQLRHDDYTVGWVCALPVELAAAQEMLDEEHGNLERDPADKDDKDDNLYSLGSISGHNVVIVCLPAGLIGNSPAAVVATRLRATFKAIRFGLMVGIGGGVPSAEADIRLGDVVVSQPHQTFGGVVQYDSGKATPSGFARTGSLNSPPHILLGAVAKARANELRGRSQLSTYVLKLERMPGFQRAKTGLDVLFEAAYDHEGGPTCDKCKPERQELRQPRESDEEVTVHYGTIASGNQVMRSAAERDKVSAELGGVLCFEMEAAGLMNSFPCLVVRGICDYADSHKNKRWQPYAAGAAAAYAKEVLSLIPPSMVEAEKKIGEVLSDLYQVAQDHRNIAGDGLAVSHKALDIQQKEHDQKLSDQQASCLQLFRLTKTTEDATYEWYKERIAGRLEGTCLWFLNHPHFQEWRRSESGPLLVSADPGCGKSVLAKYLIDYVLAESSTVCYFFFKDQVQNTVREALCALLHQLFSQKRCLLVHAMEQYGKDGAGLVNSTSSLWSVFGAAVQDANAGPITIVLDALDECAESETRDLLQHMETQVRNSASRNAKLKLFMTSRPYEHVVSKLHTLSEAFPRIRIPGEDESEAISQEVNCVIHYRVDEFAKEKGLSDKVKACLQEQLLKIEHRTYLWVYLVFDYLQDLNFKRTPKGIASTLNTLPKSVHQAYEQILNKSTDHQMVQKVLAIILAATHPLTLAEMSIAMEVDEKTKSIDDLDLEQEHDFKSRLRSWCGLFVSVHYGKIYFLHQTAREFLLAERLSSSTIQKELVWHGSTTIKDAHTVLAECCVRFLSFFDNDDSLVIFFGKHDSLVNAQDQFVKNHAFLEYSSKFWGLHVRESRICDDEEAAIAPLTFTLSDPDTKVYRIWSELYWRETNFVVPRFGTRLIVASYFWHVAAVKRMLEKGVDVNAQGGEFGTALQAASWAGHEQTVKLLLDNGADVNAQGGEYGSALQAASWAGHEQTVKLLLDNGADSNVQGGTYRNALYAASYKGHKDIVKLLLDNSADVNVQGGIYRNALQAASYEGHKDIVKLLLNNGADVNAQGGDFGNALQAASYGPGSEDLVKLLLDNNADVNAQGGEFGNVLQAASKKGNKDIVKLLLNNGADVNAQGGDFGNALQAALYEGNEDIMKLLLDNGANVNVQGGIYGNALQVASKIGNKDLVKLLLDNGADVNAQGGHFGNALQAASWADYKDIVELLLDNGADVNALQAALYDGYKQTVKLLLDNGADVNAQGGEFGNALQAAIWAGHEDIVKLLLDNNADVNAQHGGDFGNALQSASYEGNEDIVKLLLDNGADVNAQGGDFGNALQAASWAGYKDIVKLLLDNNADINAQGGEFQNALQAALSEGHEQIVTLLLDKGADVNA